MYILIILAIGFAGAAFNMPTAPIVGTSVVVISFFVHNFVTKSEVTLVLTKASLLFAVWIGMGYGMIAIDENKSQLSLIISKMLEMNWLWILYGTLIVTLIQFYVLFRKGER